MPATATAPAISAPAGIEHLPLDTLYLHPLNPRQHVPEGDAETMAETMAKLFAGDEDAMAIWRADGPITRAALATWLPEEIRGAVPSRAKEN